ncbi:hypothetical protein RE628_03095 [Paenibacillus sp. D2_2]|uniref:hypothetical protein n=1 Tax=Paenibacillus sp. D2_2 TaxID=3073092 RepID=UPI002815C36B|nr:hypothetical protein [Paenibacillus sp. D2_2]WMT41540.1 hypothetical protein RE628_03095 [Paenibacillus sp. D2_2]
METKLVQDACLLLQGEISPETGIHLELRQEDILPMVRVLNQYDLTPVRKQRHLSIYIAIKLALQSHAASNGCTGEMLTRKVLNGDYLYSLYVQLCLKWDEQDLLTHLAPIVKRIQIKHVEGNPKDTLLIEGWEWFLQLEGNCARAIQAI